MQSTPMSEPGSVPASGHSGYDWLVAGTDPGLFGALLPASAGAGGTMTETPSIEITFLLLFMLSYIAIKLIRG
jgi:hypothetical protein